jgi:hypothetical protein
MTPRLCRRAPLGPVAQFTAASSWGGRLHPCTAAAMLASPIKRRSDAASVRGPVTRPRLSHWPNLMTLRVEVAGDARVGRRCATGRSSPARCARSAGFALDCRARSAAPPATLGPRTTAVRRERVVHHLVGLDRVRRGSRRVCRTRSSVALGARQPIDRASEDCMARLHGCRSRFWSTITDGPTPRDRRYLGRTGPASGAGPCCRGGRPCPTRPRPPLHQPFSTR